MDAALYAAGREARDGGLRMADNPHPRGTPARRAWLAGLWDRGLERLVASLDVQIGINREARVTR